MGEQIKTPRKPPTLTEEQRRAKSERAKAQWAARDGKLRSAVVKSNTKEPPPNAVDIVQKACENGCTVEQISEALGVDRKLFNDWRERYPEIDMAMQAGRAVEHDKLVGVLFKAATHEKKPNLVAAIFLLKARHGYQEGVALVQNSVSINYQLPAPMTPEQYVKTIEAEAKLVQPETVKKLLAQPEVKTALKKEFAAQRREVEMGE